MSDSLRPHELQHVRLSCSPLSPGVCSNSCPLSWWSHLRLPPSSFTLNLSQIRVFSNESALHIRWSTYWSFSNRASNEYSVLISFRVDCFDLLAVQGTLKSLHQHHNCKASVLQCSAFLHGPTLTSIYDYWKNHSFDCIDLCQQSETAVSAF